MSGKVCERCGKAPVNYDLLDYCALCSRDLCDGCMAKGCCGHVPAVSGEADDAAANGLDPDLAARLNPAGDIQPVGKPRVLSSRMSDAALNPTPERTNDEQG